MAHYNLAVDGVLHNTLNLHLQGKYSSSRLVSQYAQVAGGFTDYSLVSSTHAASLPNVHW